jgi:hypothetical protein
MQDFDIDIDNEVIKDEYELIPAGTYLMSLSTFNGKEEDNGASYVMTMKFLILEGEYEGRVVSERFYTKRELPPYSYTTKAGKTGSYDPAKVGRSNLAKLALACGVIGKFTNAEQVQDIRFKGVIKHNVNKKDGKTYANLSDYLAEDATEAGIPFSTATKTEAKPAWMQ